MIDSLISGATSLIGGILGKQSQEKAQRLTMMHAADEAERQREFAQSGIQWRVKDAEKAGIHPLAALGAQTVSYSPQSIGITPDTSMASAVSAMGQDVARAVDSTRSASQKVNAYQKTVQDLTLQRMGLENQLLSSQIAKINQVGSAPPMPSSTDDYLIPGQGQTANSRVSQAFNLINTQPMERTASNPSAPHQEPGAINDVGYARTKTGYAVVPSSDVKQRIEDSIASEIAWELRNRIAPIFTNRSYSPPYPAPPGMYWQFNGIEYYLRQKGG